MGDEPKSAYLGELEELVLLAILKVHPNAYGIPIQDALEEAGRKLSVGALYATLDRLQRKGFISSWQGDPTPERGGRAKRYYEVEGAGTAAIKQAESNRRKLMDQPEPGRA
jgi:PadR family transcriptional regulator PadR